MAHRKAMLRLVIEVVSLSPVDVPRRATHVKVHWRSGVVSELELERPGRREVRRPLPRVNRNTWWLEIEKHTAAHLIALANQEAR